MNRLICISIFAALVSSAVAQQPDRVPTGSSQDTIDVQHVMDAYHEAVLTHDGSRLAALFIPEGSVWLSVRLPAFFEFPSGAGDNSPSFAQ